MDIYWEREEEASGERQIRAMSVVAARYLEKKTRRFFDCFRAPPLPVSPGSPEVDPTIDQNKRRIKKIGLIETVSRVPHKKASTRRVNRKSPISREINEFSFQGILQPTTRSTGTRWYVL